MPTDNSQTARALPTPCQLDHVELEQLLRPVKPHDNLSLDQLAQTYSFEQVSDRRRLFVNLILSELADRPGPTRVLDIGCGQGLGIDAHRHAYLRPIADAADEFWAIEPDDSIDVPNGLFDRVEHSLLEDTKLPDGSIDVAFALMVMEHVAQPLSFLQCTRRLLKPGGVFLFMTPNGGHYFTMMSSWLNRLGLADRMLDLVRRGQTEKYHYPLVYGFNRPRRIRQLAHQAGFADVTCATFEARGGHVYFPGPVKLLWRLARYKRRVIHHRQCLLNLVGRLRAPGPNQATL